MSTATAERTPIPTIAQIRLLAAMAHANAIVHIAYFSTSYVPDGDRYKAAYLRMPLRKPSLEACVRAGWLESVGEVVVYSVSGGERTVTAYRVSDAGKRACGHGDKIGHDHV